MGRKNQLGNIAKFRYCFCVFCTSKKGIRSYHYQLWRRLSSRFRDPRPTALPPHFTKNFLPRRHYFKNIAKQAHFILIF